MPEIPWSSRVSRPFSLLGRRRLRRRRAALWLVVLLGTLGLGRPAVAQPPPPSLDNNPSYDIIVTNLRPLLTLNNPDGGQHYTYDLELDTRPGFDSPERIVYRGVEPLDTYITSRRVEAEDALRDGVTYYWRARSVAADGETSSWVRSRFIVDTGADDHFMDLLRVPIASVEVSSGSASENIIDLNDFAPTTYWQSTPPGADRQWVQLDLGGVRNISRIWLLSNPDAENGRLTEFTWLASRDGRHWREIPGATISDNDTFRNILDFEPVAARFLRLSITGWEGYAAQINSIRVYSPGEPPVPPAPPGVYVLVIGNQQDGGTFTELARRIRSLGLGLDTLTVPYYEVSLDLLRALEPPPVAVVLSGSLASYSEIPMFEYNGEYEVIRQAELPVLGICCGHQQLAMAHGYTFVRGMGWDDLSSLEPPGKRTRTRSLDPEDPLFAGVPNPFVGVEVHSWSVGVIPEGYELLAESSYVQAIEQEGSRQRYGTQFHPEIRRPWNQAAEVLENFLRQALDETVAASD